MEHANSISEDGGNKMAEHGDLPKIHYDLLRVDLSARTGKQMNFTNAVLVRVLRVEIGRAV